MQADRALVELTRIVDAMDWLLGVDGAGMSLVHFDGIRWLQFARSLFQLLDDDPIVFD